jgi:hypothetical protein
MIRRKLNLLIPSCFSSDKVLNKHFKFLIIQLFNETYEVDGCWCIVEFIVEINQVCHVAYLNRMNGCRISFFSVFFLFLSSLFYFSESFNAKYNQFVQRSQQNKSTFVILRLLHFIQCCASLLTANSFILTTRTIKNDR